MEKIFILFSFYFFIIFSIIGYGNISSLIFKRTYSIGEQGLNGILLLILISYLTNFFSPHSIIHNLIIIIIGLIAFALSIFQNWRKKRAKSIKNFRENVDISCHTGRNTKKSHLYNIWRCLNLKNRKF